MANETKNNNNKTPKKKKIIVTNGKGGASKSTTAFQLFGSYFLHKKENCIIGEIDDENKDSANFTDTVIKTNQIYLGDGLDIVPILRDLMIEDNNNCLDVGGNRTTTIFLEGLKSSRMYRRTDLFVIPMSGGSQDLVNAEKTFDNIMKLDENANVLFVLSRVRNQNRYKFQYRKFFNNDKFSKYPYIVLIDSDVIDLSRDLKKSAFELANDKKYKEYMESEFDKALNENDKEKINMYGDILKVLDESSEFLKNTLLPAFEIIEKALSTK